MIREDYVKVLPSLSPNPSLDGIYKLSFGKEAPDNVDVEVYDINGRRISPVFLRKKNDGLYINLSTHASGMYFIYLITDDSQQMLKALYSKISEK